MQLIPYLNFGGQCREAFAFYRDVFDGQIIGQMTYGESPMCDQMPPESKPMIMHTCLQIGDVMLMGADGPPPHAESGQGTFINISVDKVEQAERVWAALLDGGEARMPLQETFWAQRFGMLVDRYGKPWMVNCMPADCPVTE